MQLLLGCSRPLNIRPQAGLQAMKVLKWLALSLQVASPVFCWSAREAGAVLCPVTPTPCRAPCLQGERKDFALAGWCRGFAFSFFLFGVPGWLILMQHATSFTDLNQTAGT